MGLQMKKEESTGGETIEDGAMFDAVLKSIKQETKKSRDGESYERAEWKFEISDPDGEQDGRAIWGQTGVKLVDHPDCKLTNWAESVLGFIMPVDYDFDTDQILDKPCRIMVGQREYEKDGQPRIHNFVDEVLPTAANMDSMLAERLAKAQQATDEPF